MIFSVQESLVVMLPVNIDQKGSCFSECSHADSFSVDPADTSPFHEPAAQSDHIILRDDVHRL